MNDLRERLREIERNPSPDLWDEITSRTVQSNTNDRRGLRHRVAAGLVAAVVSLAAFAFLVTMFRSESDQGAVRTSLSPLTIRVRTTNDPSDVQFSATYQGQEIELVGIETPGPDLEYPNSTPVELPVGTPIVIEGSELISVSVFELDPAQGRSVVEDGSCLIPGSLRALPGPDETAFFVYAEGKGWSGGQAFRAETVGEELDHVSALDPNSTVDASKLGLATCEGPSPAASEAEATRMPGIDAYKVCRVLSLPGDFGDAGDEAVVFEEERVPTAGCVGSEGFQHVAVLRDGRVTALSRRITDVFDEDAWRVWPYATPDLNGDGVDEIAIALRHEPGNATRVWFFVLSSDGSGLEGIYESQGSGAFSYLIGTGTDPLPYLLPQGTYGVFCDGVSDARRIVTWRVDADDPSRVAEKRWRLVSTNVEVDSETSINNGSSGYPDDGSQELCGSPVSERTVYPGQAPT